MLAAQADGLYPAEAAVLVLTHAAGEYWLRRAELREAVTAVDDGWGRDGTQPMAHLDVEHALALLDAGALPCSSSEAALLRIAASLAGAPLTQGLGQLVANLDERNLAVVLDAIAHARGCHEYGVRFTITGTPTGTPTSACPGGGAR